MRQSRWGEGKSFFLEWFGETLSESGYVVASINAWQDDDAVDPLLSVMAGIDVVTKKDPALSKKAKGLASALGKATGQVVAAAAKGLVKQVATRYLGEATKDIADAVGELGNAAGREASKKLDKLWDEQAEKLLADFTRGKKSIEQFRAGLQQFVAVLEAEIDRRRHTQKLLQLLRHDIGIGHPSAQYGVRHVRLWRAQHHVDDARGAALLHRSALMECVLPDLESEITQRNHHGDAADETTDR